MKVYLIIYESVRPGSKRKRCILLGEGREHRIPRKRAEEFLLMMEEMTKPDKVSKPFPSFKRFFSPKEGEEQRVLELFQKILNDKKENKIKWWFMICFP